MSKSDKIKKHNKAMRSAKQAKDKEMAERKKDLRFERDKFPDSIQEVEFLLKQAGLK